MRRLLLLPLLAAPAAYAQPYALAGTVHGPGHAPVPGATVQIAGTTRGTTADADGRFRLDRLEVGRYTLVVSAVGYRTVRLETSVPRADLAVMLAEAMPELGETVVSAQARVAGDVAAPPDAPRSTDDLFARVAGMQAVARGGFAWEPQIRGFGLGPVALSLDGMKVYGACVDRMDPASSYIEPENLAQMRVSKGPADLSMGSQTAGSVDFVSEDPVFGPASARLDAGAETRTGQRRVSAVAGASAGPVAVRVSGVYRTAEAYAVGGGRSNLPYSGFTKRNGRIAATLCLSPQTDVTAQALADDAWNVGYPVLLMDATLASARLGSVRLRRLGANGSDVVTLYANRVDHWMDDRHRDVLERPVMTGMFMPMAGYTATTGALAASGREWDGWTVGGTLDLHRVVQFGDMWMYSLYPGIADMYLLNVGHAEAVNAAASAQIGRTVGRFAATVQLRLDGTRRDVRDATAQALLLGRFPGLDTAAAAFARPSASLTVGYDVGRGLHLHAALARTARLPTLVEQYGHYVYNYTDGYFYTGDPRLRGEASTGVEAGLDWMRPRLTVRVNGFAHRVSDHIAGSPDPTVTGTAGSTYRFRVFDASGTLAYAGVEASGVFAWTRRTSVSAQLAAVTARHSGGNVVHDPAHLRTFAPPSGRIALRHERRWGFVEIEGRGALASERLTDDVPATDAFAVLNASGGVQMGRHAELRAVLENAFDRFYRERQSVGGLPGRARALYVSLRLAW